MNSVHLKIKDIQCPSCDKKFGTSGALRYKLFDLNFINLKEDFAFPFYSCFRLLFYLKFCCIVEFLYRSHKKKFHPEGGQVSASAPCTTNNTSIQMPSTSQQATAPPTESKQQNKTNLVPAILSRATTSSAQTQPSTSNSVSIAV
jgi:hypothetical protein